MKERKEEAKHILTKKINRTTYHVYACFSQTSKENVSDKVKRLIENEIKSENFANNP